MHAHTRIQAKSACFRILGFYSTREQALESIPAREKDDQGEIRIAPQGEFRLLMDKTPTVENREYESTKTSALISKHLHYVRQQQDKIKKRMAFELPQHMQAPEDTETSDISEISQISEIPEDISAHVKALEPLTALAPLSSSFELRNQSFAVVAIIPDYVRREKYVATYRKILHSYLLDFWDVSNPSIFQDNPPPHGLSIYGCEGSLFEKNGISPELSSIEFEHWFKAFVTHHSMPTTMNMLRDGNYKGANEEPAIAFLKVGATEQELKDWIQTSEHKNDLAIVPMYEIGCVKDVYTAKKKYSNDILNTLIK
jgi:hypothetical protein